MAEAKPAKRNYLTAGRDRFGNIRMSEGHGALVAAAHHNQFDIQGWLETVRSPRTREQYEAALTLMLREADGKKTT